MISAIIQAREDSSRLPNKIFKKIIDDDNSLSLILKRLNKSKKIDKIIIAVPNQSKKFDSLKKKFKNIEVFKGNKYNVLKRYHSAASFFNISTIIRITSDCPLIDFRLIDKMIKNFQKYKVDYYSNCISRSFPDGYDIEVFNFKSLNFAFKNAKSKYDKEHVTPYLIKSNKIKKRNYKISPNLYFLRCTLDDINDLKFIRKIYKLFAPRIYFGYQDVKKLFYKNPNFFIKKW
jgi:spore coat polysaccharide biosynthesis protein SpsF (cytidylyltransferase family)